MFTGLIEGKGKVKSVRRVGDDIRLIISPLFKMSDVQNGDSICVDGVCLTVAEISEGAFAMDVSGETISRSTLKLLRRGHDVNLERALRFTDRLGGHLVSGHVDGVGKITKKEQAQRSWIFGIGIDKQLSRYTIEKGSIAVDGISLTINRCEDTYFEVNVIPQTGVQTTILEKKVGDPVNVETDLIGKYVEKFVSKDRSARKENAGSGINMEMLIEKGFGE